MRRFLLMLVLLSLALPAVPCEIPVFKYALERWPADPYEVMLFHSGTMDAGSKALADWLYSATPMTGGGPNIDVIDVDVAARMEPDIEAIWAGLNEPAKKAVEAKQTWAVIRAPSEGNPVVHSRALSDEIKGLLDSPARREVARRILSGQAAVWVIVSGPDADRAAQGKVEAALKDASQAIELRRPTAGPDDGDAPDGDEDMQPADEGPAVHPEFSVVRIDRRDPAEQHFVSMLMGVDPDAAKHNGPIVVPVFGQGRALTALYGDGLTEGRIRAVCEFLAGDCSCEVKAQNPGVDMLMWADWTAGPSVAPEAALPESLRAPVAATGPAAIAPAQTAIGGVWLKALMALGGLAIAAGLLAALARRSEAKRP